MTKVVFDSSFLMAVAERPTAWFEDILSSAGKFEPVLLGCVRDELQKLSLMRTKRARLARLALGLSASFSQAQCGGAAVDDEIVSFALSTNALVATVDTELRHALESSHVRVVYLKGGRVAVA